MGEDDKNCSDIPPDQKINSSNAENRVLGSSTSSASSASIPPSEAEKLLMSSTPPATSALIPLSEAEQSLVSSSPPATFALIPLSEAEKSLVEKTFMTSTPPAPQASISQYSVAGEFLPSVSSSQLSTPTSSENFPPSHEGYQLPFHGSYTEPYPQGPYPTQYHQEPYPAPYHQGPYPTPYHQGPYPTPYQSWYQPMSYQPLSYQNSHNAQNHQTFQPLYAPTNPSVQQTLPTSTMNTAAPTSSEYLDLP